MRELLFLCVFSLLQVAQAQQCTIFYLQDLDPSLEEGYQFSEGWRVQNLTSGCNAVDYYLTPQSAQISYDLGSTWQSYSGMNFEFYRTSPPNQSNVLQSDRFSINSGQVVNVVTRFNVSPANSEVHYRVFFDIFDSNDNVLPPLPGGRLYTEFYYPVPEADLIVENASLFPGTIAPGETVTVNFTVSNIGYTSTIPTHLRVYYSNNSSWSSSSDPQLDDIVISGLAPGESLSYSTTVTVPTDALDGDRYIFLYADALGQVDEIQEGSANRERLNILVASSPTNDITIEDVSLNATTFFRGDDIEFQYTHTYSGNQLDLGSINSHAYLSTDCVIDASDELIDDSSSNLDRDQPTSIEYASEYINSGVTPGTYYIIIVGDYFDEVSEDNENNNQICIEIEISDEVNYLTINETITNTTIEDGETTFVEYSISDALNGDDRVYVGYYLSTDCLFDPSLDTYLDNDNHNFNVSSISFESETLTIPSGTPAGTYYILIVTDYEFEILENNENDNVHCFQITVTNTCTPPQANFITYGSEVEQGQYLQIQDNSPNAATWQYTFPGGNPATYDDPNLPLIQFNEVGDQTISLTVTNGCGTDTNTAVIRVTPDQELPPPPHSEICNSSIAGDPITMSTGAYVYAVEDLRVRGINGSYSWRRFYNSSLDYEGNLGVHWTHSYDISLDIDGSAWTVQHGNGQRTYYAGYDDGTTLPLYEGTLSTLAKNITTNTYTFTKQDGTVYIFDSNGCIQTITNRVGNTITFTHSNCQLTRITFPGGRYFDLTYTGNRITRVTDNTGRFVTYLYSGNQENLVNSTDVRGGTTFFTYDASNRLLTQTDPRGNTMVSNTYNGSGQIIAQSDALGYTTTLSYDTPVLGATTMINTLNGTQVHYHNDKFRLTRFTNELNEDIVLGYDSPTAKIKSFTNEAGNTVFYDLDDNGNLILVQDVLTNQTNIAFNSLNLPTTITNALGYVTTLGYDGVGNPTTLTLANGAVYTSTYDSNGQLINRTTPNGNSTTYQRNSFGDITSIQTLTGSYTITVDNLGRVTAMTDRNGNTTSFQFDAAGNITRITDTLGYFIVLTYDANDNLTSYQDKEGAITTFTYNERNELIVITDPLGYTKYLVYDGLGRLTSSTDANGNVVILSYDAKGQLISTTNALGTYTMSYDVTGNVINITDAEGNTYEIEYDDKNRPVVTRDPLGHETQLVYDALDQLLSATDANGNTTINTFDAMGWLVSITDALGGVVSYSRDLEGNLTGITGAKGNTTTNTFDAQGRKTSTTYPGGYTSSNTYDNEGLVVTSIDENNLLTTVLRDANYNLTGLLFSNGESYAFTNDKEGRLLDMTNSAGTTTMARDARGYVVEVDDSFGNTIGLGYDGNGNRVYTAYALGDTIRTTFNALDLPMTITDWLGNSSQRTYDANGDLTGIVNSNGTSTTITRDALGRIINYTNLLADLSIINSHAITYDPVGNVDEVTNDVLLEPNYFPSMEAMLYASDDRQIIRDGSPVTADDKGAITSLDGTPTSSFTWGQDDLLTGYTHQGSTVTNTYNPFADRLQKTKDGQTTNYLLDPVSGLTNILQEQETDGTVRNSYIYAPDGLRWKIDANGDAQFYHFDFLGTTKALTDESGTITDAYATDAFGDYFAHNGNTDQPFVHLGQFGIEHEGNGIYRHRRRYVDAPNGRFISKDMAPVGAGTQQTNQYVYGLNNPYRWMDIDGYENQDALALGGSTVGISPSVFSEDIPAPYFEPTIIYAYNPETDPLPTFEEVEQELSNPNNYVLTNPTNSCSGYEEMFIEGPQLYDPTFEILFDIITLRGVYKSLLKVGAKGRTLLEAAVKGKGNFNLGKASYNEAIDLGKRWVGEGYTIASDGKTLISSDRLRAFRPPSYKPFWKKLQANFEWREIPKGRWQGNGHLDIIQYP